MTGESIPWAGRVQPRIDCECGAWTENPSRAPSEVFEAFLYGIRWTLDSAGTWRCAECSNKHAFVVATCACGCPCADMREAPWRGKGPDVGPSIEIIGWRKIDGRWSCPHCTGNERQLRRAKRKGLAL